MRNTAEDKIFVEQLFRVLSKRHREIVMHRFGVGAYTATQCTYREIGCEYGLSPNRVRQIVVGALGRMHRYFSRSIHRDFKGEFYSLDRPN